MSLSDFHKRIYRQILAAAPHADLPWRDIVDLLQQLPQTKLNSKNPGEIDIHDEKTEEVTLAYKPFHPGGEQPIVVIRRKHEPIRALPDDLKRVQDFLIRAGFPEKVV